MRKFPLSVLMLAFGVWASAQQLKQPVSITSYNFSEKSKKQKKFGDILLGSGAGLVLAGIFIPRGKLVQEGLFGGGIFLGEQYKNDNLKGVILLGGILSAVASIPFYVMAKKNRRRAASVSFEIQQIQRFVEPTLVSTSVPAFSFKVYF